MQPPNLKVGSKVALVAPARKITFQEIEYALSILESWGLDVVYDDRLFRDDNQFGGTDKERLQHFQEMLDDPDVASIISVRGGYGTSRIIDKLDFELFKLNPKWICGYSDITVLLFHIYNFGIESIHSSMPMLFQRDSIESLESLRQILFGEKINFEIQPHILNREGSGRGKLIGGNLSIINHLIGTSSDIDTQNIILFIEDIDEYLYNIDRMMIHLKRAGKLTGISGLIVGHMTDMKDNLVPFGKSAYEIILDQVKEFEFPVCFGFPIGHEPQNLALPCGREALLKVTSEGGSLTF